MIIIDGLLDRHIERISSRLMSAEEEYFKIAGERLLELSGLDAESAKERLYSGGFLEEADNDLRRLKRILDKAHRENLRELLKLFNAVTDAAYETWKELKEGAG